MQNPRPTFESQTSLPILSSAGQPWLSETRLCGIVRDPQWIFLYWTLQPYSISASQSNLGGVEATQFCKRILRLLDVTDILYDGANAWRSYDTVIDDVADNWYLKVPEPGRDYLVELGLVHLNGSFSAIARSNSVATPSGRACEDHSEDWATITIAPVNHQY